MTPSAKHLIDKLKLLPHPEGGYYRETYRSNGVIPQSALTGFAGDRNFSTAIYFMLTSETFSAFHRIRQDEIWHFYSGSPLYIHVIGSNGEYHRNTVGVDNPQLVVKAGDWFGASVVEDNSFSLVGCTVAPGFDYKDFEMAKRDTLISLFPEHEEIITKLTRS